MKTKEKMKIIIKNKSEIIQNKGIFFYYCGKKLLKMAINIIKLINLLD